MKKVLFARILSLLLAMGLMLCACSDPMLLMPPDDNTPEQSDTGVGQETKPPLGRNHMVLSYYSGEPLNPIKAQGRTNLIIGSLICDNLVDLNDSFEPVPALAQSFEWEGDDLVITLRDDAMFHDGTPLVASHVADTLNEIRTSPDSPYFENLESVTAVRAQDKRTVRLTAPSGGYGLLSLLNIPIVREKEGIPMGTGRYRFEKGQKTDATLRAFDGWWGGGVRMSTIELISMPDADAADYAFTTGQTDIKVSEPFDPPFLYASGNDITELRYPSSIMVYLAVNTGRSDMDISLRRAVSDILFKGNLPYRNSRQTRLPFSPYWWGLAGMSDPFSASPAEPYIPSDEGRELVIMVNEENDLRIELGQKIVSQLKLNGIKSRLHPVAWEQYLIALDEGDFDLAICETALGPSMDISPLVSPEGTLNFSNSQNLRLNERLSVMARARTAHELQAAADTASAAFVAELPFIPLFFRNGSLYVKTALKGGPSPVEGSLLKGLERCEIG